MEIKETFINDTFLCYYLSKLFANLFKIIKAIINIIKKAYPFPLCYLVQNPIDSLKFTTLRPKR